MANNLYPNSFCAGKNADTLAAAHRILAALPPGLTRRRIAALGRGSGTFLTAAVETGSTFAYGYENGSEEKDTLPSAIKMREWDPEGPLVGPAVDLVVLLSPANGVPPDRAEALVRDLVALAPAVFLASGAHPDDPGSNVLAELFAAHGYLACDGIGPDIREGHAVPAAVWPKEVLFVAGETARTMSLIAAQPKLPDGGPPDLLRDAIRRRQAQEAQQQ